MDDYASVGGAPEAYMLVIIVCVCVCVCVFVFRMHLSATAKN